MRIALNGCGRIGKTFIRALLHEGWGVNGLDLVAINLGPGCPDTIEYMLKYDTLLGSYQGDIYYKDGTLYLEGKKVVVLAEKNPLLLPWKKLAVDWVIDASGCFTHAEDAKKHIEAGAKKVLITAPAHGADASIIPGVNLENYSADHRIISLGSCTTNALLPLLKIIHEEFIIEHAAMTTIHAYTNSQHLLDVDPSIKDVRRSRAAAVNIVPTSTGAMKMVNEVMPELTGRVTGSALRVPVPVVSLIDLTFVAKKKCAKESINELCQRESDSRMKGVVGVSKAPLVSSDYIHNSHSVVVDEDLTGTCGPVGKLFGWYDNEWGYSCRLKDFLVYVQMREGMQ